MPENEDLKLIYDTLLGKGLGRPKVAASSVVDQNVEMISFC